MIFRFLATVCNSHWGSISALRSNLICVCHVFHQVTHLAAKVSAQLVNRLRPSPIPLLVQDLREGHAVQAGGSCNLTDGNAAAISELLFLNHFC